MALEDLLAQKRNLEGELSAVEFSIHQVNTKLSSLETEFKSEFETEQERALANYKNDLLQQPVYSTSIHKRELAEVKTKLGDINLSMADTPEELREKEAYLNVLNSYSKTMLDLRDMIVLFIGEDMLDEYRQNIKFNPDKVKIAKKGKLQKAVKYLRDQELINVTDLNTKGKKLNVSYSDAYKNMFTFFPKLVINLLRVIEMSTELDNIISFYLKQECVIAKLENKTSEEIARITGVVLDSIQAKLTDEMVRLEKVISDIEKSFAVALGQFRFDSSELVAKQEAFKVELDTKLEALNVKFGKIKEEIERVDLEIEKEKTKNLTLAEKQRRRYLSVDNTDKSYVLPEKFIWDYQDQITDYIDLITGVVIAETEQDIINYTQSLTFQLRNYMKNPFLIIHSIDPTALGYIDEFANPVREDPSDIIVGINEEENKSQLESGHSNFLVNRTIAGATNNIKAYNEQAVKQDSAPLINYVLLYHVREMPKMTPNLEQLLTRAQQFGVITQIIILREHAEKFSDAYTKLNLTCLEINNKGFTKNILKETSGTGADLGF